jgi:hypothetical protein
MLTRCRWKKERAPVVPANERLSNGSREAVGRKAEIQCSIKALWIGLTDGDQEYLATIGGISASTTQADKL